jgi:hypothetical protein
MPPDSSSIESMLFIPEEPDHELVLKGRGFKPRRNSQSMGGFSR